MNYLHKGILSLAIGVSFLSCEKETIKEGVITESAIQEDASLVDIVAFSELTGNIGQSFSYIDGKSKAVSSLGEAELTTAKFLYIDTDNIDSLAYSYDDLLDWSYESKTGLIFESATGNHENTDNFYSNTVGGAGLSYMVEGLVVEQSELDDQTSFIVVNAENSIGAEDAIDMFLHDLYVSKYPLIPVEEPIFDEELIIDDENSVSNDVIYESSASSSQKYRYATYTNISYDAAVKAAIAREKKLEPNYALQKIHKRVDRFEAHIVSRKDRKKVWLKKGEVHDANKRCRNQQSASYSKALNYSKSWSTSASIGLNVGPFSFGGSYSYGSSTTKGTTDGSSLSMRKRYAQGGVFVFQEYLTGYVSGQTRFQLKMLKFDGTAGNIYMDVKINYTGKKNNWEGPRAQTKPAFGWATWGYTLKDCS